ncbi:MAG: protease SohB [Chromatiales bacterium]|nr:protease SohB [Chromatiales bacterium]
MEFLYEYGMFLAKVATIVIAIVFVIIMSIGLGRKEQSEGGLQVRKLNDKYREMATALRRAMLSGSALRAARKVEKAEKRKASKSARDKPRRRAFVLDFRGDIRATGVAALREEISAVLAVAGGDDEVVLRLENYGGAVHEHGLAASQLERIRARGVRLTAVVDKVAASGGYLMACVANRIIAAPFAVIGSIGVLAQLPNFHRALESRGVDFEQVTAGRYKRTVTMFGRNTDEDRAKLKEELEEVHLLFKQAVTQHRPDLDVEQVATGEHWYGTRAKELGLVDELGSSDDYLMKLADDADLFHIRYRVRPTLTQRVMGSMDEAGASLEAWLAQRGRERMYR